MAELGRFRGLQGRPGVRRAVRHLCLFGLATVLTAGIFATMPSERLIFRISMATAYASAAYLVAVLAIGPINVLRRRSNPVSTYLRRDIGIWAGVLAVLHLIAGLFVHFDGKMLNYFFSMTADGNVVSVRIDPFGAANYLGAAAGVIFVILLGLSNNMSLRWLRSARWKSAQRLLYPCVIFVIIHAVIYQLHEGRSPIGMVVLFVLIALGSAIQMAGYKANRLRG